MCNYLLLKRPVETMKSCPKGMYNLSLVVVNVTEMFCKSSNALSFNVYKYSISDNPMIGVVKTKNLP